MFLKKLKEDTSHVTTKLKQALNFLIHNNNSNFKKFEELIIEGNEYVDFTLYELLEWMDNPDFFEIINHIPPSIFDIEFILKDFSKENSLSTFNDLSSGEQQLIHATQSIVYHLNNLQSVNYSIIDRVKYKSINVVFDEIELYFHPEYQRKFINELLRSLEKIYLGNVKGLESINIQFLTHSPFILSDIPTSNILKLENGNKELFEDYEKTFGANIHEQLTQSFFLESTTGEFALKKITKIVEFYYELRNSRDKEKYIFYEKYLKMKDEFHFIMNNVGEDVIKGLVENHIGYIEEYLSIKKIMNKVNYPKDSKELVKFEQSYRDCLDISKIVEINKHLNKILYKGKLLDFDSLVTYSFEDLIDLDKIISKYSKKLNVTKKVKSKKIIENKFENLFDYKCNQPKIADFFMKKDYFNFKVCHYCGIEYINAFTDLDDYFDGLDFLNKADIYDLQIVKGIGKERAQSIIDKRNITKFNDIDEIGLTKNIRDEIKRFDFKNGHNHFTLDHVIPQKTHKFYSLCLYNFVPSCFSCNSKFKKAKEFILNDDLKKISPTSNLYSFTDDFKFKLYYKRELKKIKTNSDFVVEKTILSNDAQIRQFLSIFKINGRYVFHKDQVLRLVEKKIMYPNTKIKELSKKTGKSIEVLKREIFGEELFDKLNSDLPFIKLKKDIAIQLKIIK